MSQLFGTDGIRGEVNREPLLPGKILQVGLGLGEYWKRTGTGSNYPIIIGHDSRLSGTYLEKLLSSALLGMGFDVLELDLISTPALSYLVKNRQTAGGIMISASHNPFYDNGIKPFQPGGEKFTDSQERMVENIISENSFDLALRERIGSSCSELDWLDDYISALKSRPANYDGHVVIDCANGASSQIAPAVLEEKCGKLTVLNNNPDGTNINLDCGSLHVDELVSRVESSGADLGFAFDGDADRVLAVDEYGRVVDGDTLMYALVRNFSLDSEEAGGLVITVMSNLGLRVSLEKAGIDYSVVGVGDRQVYEKMKDKNWRLGGEQSGHIIDRNWLPTGDGLNTVVNLLSLLENKEGLLADFNDEVPNYPQVLYNIEVESKPPLDELVETSKLIDEVESELGSEGRVLVRYSGTETLGRVMIEGSDEKEIKKHAIRISDLMQKEINQLGEKND